MVFAVKLQVGLPSIFPACNAIQLQSISARLVVEKWKPQKILSDKNWWWGASARHLFPFPDFLNFRCCASGPWTFFMAKNTPKKCCGWFVCFSQKGSRFASNMGGRQFVSNFKGGKQFLSNFFYMPYKAYVMSYQFLVKKPRVKPLRLTCPWSVSAPSTVSKLMVQWSEWKPTSMENLQTLEKHHPQKKKTTSWRSGDQEQKL